MADEKGASAAVAAVMGKAKLHGLLIEKNEHTGKNGGPKREGRQDVAVEQLQSNIKAERERIDSDAKVQNLSDYDFCVQSLRSRRMPIEPCEQLRGL